MDRDVTILLDPSTGLPLSVTAGILDVNATFGGVVVVSVPSVGLTGAAVPAQADQVGGPDAAGLLRAQRLYDTDSGAGSEFTLGTVLRATSNGGSVEVGTSANPLRVDPTGSTSQPTTNPTQLPGSLGQKLMAASLPVVLASDQSALPVTAASLPLPTGAATEVTLAAMSAKLPAALVGGRLDENVGAWMGSTAPTVGQKTMVASLPVALASDQSALAVTVASLPLPTGAATEVTLAAMSAKLPAALVGGRLDENLGAWLGSTAPTVGQKLMASSLPVAFASDQSALAVTSTQLPVALVGGRLDDNIGAWGGTATTVGSKTMAASVPVVLASDQTQFPAALVGGRLDVNVGAWLASTAPTVGSKTSANSIPVVIASDQDFVSVGGGALPTRGVQVGGTDGANYRNVRLLDLDTGAGTQYWLGANLRISGNGGSIEAKGQQVMASSLPVVWASDFVPGNVTYTASIAGLLSDAAGATAIMSLFGSGTKTIYVMRVSVSATATAGANTSALLKKLSAVYTGGTSAAMTAVPHDSSSAAATGTPLSWTVSPTGGGTLVGLVGATKLNVAAPATVTAPPTWVWKFGGPMDAQPIVLRGTTQGIALDLNGAVLAGSSFNIEVEWTEA